MTAHTLAPIVRMPIVGLCRDPLNGMKPGDMHECALLVSIEELAPTGQVTGLLIARINGEWILNEDWPLVRTMPGDVVEFFDMPSDKDSLRAVLSIAVLVASIYFGQPQLYGAWVGAAIGIVGSLAVNALLPPTSAAAGAEGKQAANVYSSSLQGNQATIDQPIWKTFGRRRFTPPFGAQPYYKFIPKADPDGTGDTSDQYFYGLFAIGEGNHSIERELLGDTLIENFQDVLVHSYLPPGTAPTHVLPNVSTAVEVSNQTLASALYVGGFAACAPLRTCSSFGIDIVATRGLGKGTDPLTVAWQIEYQVINDFGIPQSDWEIVANESRTAATNTPQRWSTDYTIATDARIQIRIVRTDEQDTDPSALHEIAWTSLRAYLSQPSPLNEHTAHYEIVMRASDQLNSQTQNQFSVIATGLVRSWNPDTGWLDEAPSRNGAWHIVEMASSAVNGLGYPDERIDLQSFYDLSVTADKRQDRCDWTFDNSTDAWSAMQLIARTMRARVFIRNGKLTVARDEWVSLPVTAFTPRNTQPKSMVLHEVPANSESYDGVIIEYEDYRTWTYTPIEAPCPGVTTMTRALRKRIDGITGPTHAKREALFEAASMLYRTASVSMVTEMQGLLPACMDMVRWMPELRGYGQSGDVAFWDPDTLVMGLSEPIVFGELPMFLTLMRDDGSCTVPVAVLQGPTSNDVVLPDVPDFDLVLDDGTRERPQFLIGPLTTSDEVVKLSSIRDGGQSDDGDPLIAIDGIVDDKRAHDADKALLPGPGDVQDPVDTSTSEGGGGGTVAVLVRLKDHTFICGDTLGVGVDAVPYDVSVTVLSNGCLRVTRTYGTSGTPDVPETHSVDLPVGEWLNSAVETSVAGEFDLRVTFGSAPLYTGIAFVNTSVTALSAGSDAMNTWLNLATDRLFKIDSSLTPILTGGGAVFAWAAALIFEIRRTSTGVVQATRSIGLVMPTGIPIFDGT